MTTTEPVELSPDVAKSRDLILRNLQEALGADKLTKQLVEGKEVSLYWGTAPTGKPHVGYMVPMQKIADFLLAGLKVTILFADLHAYLDNMKSTFEMLDYRVEYYQRVIKALLKSLNVPLDKLHFVRGRDIQLTPKYTQDVLQLCGHVSQRDALRAGAEVVKQVESPLLSGLLYPLLQAVDEQHLRVSGQFGGVDQRKIFILAEEQLPKVKLGKRWHLMNHMVPGLTGGKMSSSELDSKIDLLDPPEIVAKKIDSALCERGSPEDNGVLAFIRFVCMPIAGPDAVVLGGERYTDYESIKDAFEDGKLEADDLKVYLKDFLNEILDHVREECNQPDHAEIMAQAYPENLDAINSDLSDALAAGAKFSGGQEARVNDIAAGCELLGSNRLTTKLQGPKPLRAVWRLSTKGRVNLAHVAGLIQLKRLRKAGVDVAVVISGLGGFLDNAKCPWKAMEARSKYYAEAIRLLATAVGLKDLEIILSSTFEYEAEYTQLMYQMASNVTRDDSAVVPGNTLANHLVPLYNTLDLHYADADIALVGAEQKPLAQLSQKLASAVRLSPPAVLLFPTIPGIDGKDMSASAPENHIDVNDTPKQIKAKVGRSFCEPANLAGNVSLELANLIIFPLAEGNGFTIQRPEQYGGNLEISDYAALEKLFVEEKLHPVDLKPFVADRLSALLEPVRKALASQTKAIEAAFPKVQKKK